MLSDNPRPSSGSRGRATTIVCFDAQHGLLDYRALLAGTTALDARGCPGLVRVQHNQQFWIGQALDVGADAAVLCLTMIETAEGLANVEEIAATPGVDGLYIGPSDLRLGLGGATPSDPALDDAFDEALQRVLAAGTAAGLAVGIHCPSGEVAAQRFAAGFSWASIASDLTHLEQAAAAHLEAAAGS